MAELSYKLIGSRLRTARLDSKLTQDQVSEQAGISSQHLSHIESATTKLSLPCLVNLCNALKVSPNDILLDCITAPVDQIHIDKDIQRTFADTTTEEARHMLAISNSLKESLRTSTDKP